MITEFCARKMAKDVIKIVEINEAQRKGGILLRLENYISGSRDRVRTDKGRLKQVLLNLVQNAIRESTNDSTIAVDICLKRIVRESEQGHILSSSLV